MARGDILVFSDATAMYASDAVQRLVDCFDDRSVGTVEGRRTDTAIDESSLTDTEVTFRNYESWIKKYESIFYTCVGAVGPIYAVRRGLYVEVSTEGISDLMHPLLVLDRYGKNRCRVFKRKISLEVMTQKHFGERQQAGAIDAAPKQKTLRL